MGTFTASKIRTSRKQRICRDGECDKTIQPGDKYLSFAPGLYTRIAICSGCALKLTLYGPKYDCDDVRTELENQQ
jgi:hypothetical protein